VGVPGALVTGWITGGTPTAMWSVHPFPMFLAPLFFHGAQVRIAARPA
jgi:hypothetical protein